MPEKWLLLSGSYGGGHDAARDALAEVLAADGCEVRTADMAELYGKGGAAGSKRFFELSQRVPVLWDGTFELLDTRLANAALELLVKSFPHGAFDRLVDGYAPDFVVATFPHWQVFLKDYAQRKGKSFKAGVVVTDAGEVAMPWYYGSRAVDRYFSIDEGTAKFLAKKTRGKIPCQATFFPLADRYFTDKDGTPSGTAALLLTGVPGAFCEAFVRAAGAAPEIKKLVVVCGREPRLFKKLKRKAAAKVEFHEWWDVKARLKDVDVFVGKAGGALTCECVAQDVPLLVPSFIPGQEEGNVALLTAHGVGVYEPDPLRACVLARFLDVRKMLPNFRALKKRGSARAVVQAMREA